MKSGVYAGSHKQLTSQERPGLCLTLSHRLTRAHAKPPTLTPTLSLSQSLSLNLKPMLKPNYDLTAGARGAGGRQEPVSVAARLLE